MNAIRIIAGTLIWSAWSYAFGVCVWYRATATQPQSGSLLGDLLFLSVFAWLILLDDPPANYPSYAKWWAARQAGLARRKRWFTPIPL